MATPANQGGLGGIDPNSPSDAQQQNLAAKSKIDNKEFQNRVIEWTKSTHMRCRTIRQQMERQWYINMAFYIGRQNVSVIPVSNGGNAAAGVRLYVPPAPYYRARPVINRIRPIIRNELAKLTAQKPTATIVPSTGEDEDLAAATAGEQIWESIYRAKKIDSVFRQAMMWTLSTGNGFIKTYWDPEKKDKTGGMGDFCYENVTPFHLFVPDMLAEDIEDQPYVIHIQTKSPEYIKMHYPGVNPVPNVMEASDLLNDSFLQLVGAQDFRREAVLCYEVWVKPGNVEFMPNGGMFTIVGDTVVQFVEGNPYMHQEYPFTKFGHLPNGRFYCDSVINDLIPIQREYNRTRGQMIEAKNKMAHPQLIAAQGSIDASKMTTEPGQVIQYKLGYPKPEPLPLQNLPNYVMQEVDRLLMDFEDISGQHQVSKGNAPAGVTAATAINFLQEQDESMLSTTFANIEKGYEKIGYQTLCYVKQYWDVPRMVKITGKDGTFNVMSFAGADLRDNTDIRVEAGSALPTSRAAKQAFLMDLMGQGFIPPEKGLELLDVGGVQRLYDDIKVDSAQASRENMRMAAVTQDILDKYAQTFLPPPPSMDPLMGAMGELASLLGGPQGGMPQDPAMGGDPMMGGQQQGLVDPNTGQPLVDASGMPAQPPLIVPVNSFDNHQVHIQVHNTYRKGQQYESASPETKALFEEHVNQHMMAMGVVPGAPAPMPGQNSVTSGGMEGGQVPDEMLQMIAGGTAGQPEMPPEESANSTGEEMPPGLPPM